MNLIMQYGKSHIKSIFLFLVMIAVNSVILYFFNVPAIVPLYTALVCITVGGMIGIFDFSRYAKKHRQLSYMEKEITDAMDHLPRPWDLIEEDYQNIIQTSFEDRMARAYEADRRYNDMMEYYTMWVHQIKTPIAAMRLILQTSQIPERGELQEELFKIEQYVEMVLCYLRLDGESDYVLKYYDLDQILKQAVRKYAGQFIRNKCKLIYEPVQCSVLTDEKWLLFVIEQVISNALKYTREGEVEISLREPKTLAIKDNGMGISQEDLPRIFEKGYTGYNGRADKKSTGIGLYLCKRITDQLGHYISVHSAPGEGTEVLICLERYDLKTE